MIKITVVGHHRGVKVRCEVRTRQRFAIGKVRGAQVLLRPALVADLHGVVNVAVHIRHREVTRTRLSVASGFDGLRSERQLVSVGCAGAVGSVCPHMVGGVGLQTVYLRGETAQTGSHSKIIVADGRIGCGAPAEAACRDVRTAVVGDNTAANGARGRHIRQSRCDQRRQNGIGITRGKRNHLAVSRTRAVLSVCHNIIGGVGIKVLHRGGESAHTAADISATAIGIFQVRRVSPTESALRHLKAIVGNHLAMTNGRLLRDVTHRQGLHRCHHWLCHGGEGHILTIANTCAVDGVSPHMVGGAWGQIFHHHTVVTRSSVRMRCMVVGKGRVRGSAPADAAFGHHSTTVLRYAAFSLGVSFGNVGHLLGLHGGHKDELSRLERHLFAVNGVAVASGVGPHIVGGERGQTRDLAGENARAGAVNRVVVGYGRGWIGAPADTARRHRRIVVIEHLAAANCGNGLDLRHRTGAYREHRRSVRGIANYQVGNHRTRLRASRIVVAPQEDQLGLPVGCRIHHIHTDVEGVTLR